MKLIATAQTFSRNDIWIEFEVYKHGERFRVQEEECGLGWGILCDAEQPERHWAKVEEVRHILTMDCRDAGVVEIVDEAECNAILEAAV